jgi:ABC-2 type transport system permease protein
VTGPSYAGDATEARPAACSGGGTCSAPGERVRAAGRLGHRLTSFAAQTRAELRLTLRQSEALLVTLGIPVLLLVVLSLSKVLPTGTAKPISFLAPGILSLSVMSTAMVSTGIATAFDRRYGVLKRLGATPLGRPALLGAKITSILVVESIQVVVVGAVAAGLGWHLRGDVRAAAGALLLATVCFTGLGMLLAGTLRAELVLAVANGLYLVLLLLGGMIFPLTKLPGALQAVAKGLPAAALSSVLYHSLGPGGGSTLWAWIVLGAWAVGAPVAAALSFKWE